MRGAIVGICAVGALAVLITWLSSKHVSWVELTPAELALKGSNLQPPVAQDCSEFQRALASTRSGHKRPLRSTTVLSEDEVAIYRAVIQSWVSDGPTSLNVFARTFPLSESSSGSGVLECGCLIDIEAGSLFKAFHSFHTLTRDVLPKRNMRLVDADKQAIIVASNDPSKIIDQGKPLDGTIQNAVGNGLFSMSEIAFDPKHQHALVSYSFRCGLLCGNGATFIFEKLGGEWKRTDRMCGGWSS